MREIYNANNLKVYADSEEHVFERGITGPVYFLKYGDSNVMFYIRETANKGCVITVKGNKVTMEGDVHSADFNNTGFDLILKGNIHITAWHWTDSSKSQYTHRVHDTSSLRVYQYAPHNHTYFLYGNAELICDVIEKGSNCDIFAYGNSRALLDDEVEEECTITLYDNSTANIRGTDSTVWAYDNSTVFSEDDENIHLFDNATHSYHISRFF